MPREFALYCLTDVASFGTFTDSAAGLDAEWEEETEHVDSEHNGARGDTAFVRVDVGEQMDLSRQALAHLKVGDRIRINDGANPVHEAVVEGFSILGDQGFIARIKDSTLPDMSGAYLDHTEVIEGIDDPEPGDIIACTLVGDDEVTDEAVAMGDRVIADLEQAGFKVVRA